LIPEKCQTFHTFQKIKSEVNERSSMRYCIKNHEEVKRKLSHIIASGPGNLQIISDFDWCMSKFRHNGVPNATCHGIFEHDPEVVKETQDKLRMLRQTYNPVEEDPHMPLKIKIPYMQEWWDLTHKIIVSATIHRDGLTTTVNECNLAFRDKVFDFMTVLHKHNIPMLIFSAGLGNVIELLLERYEVCFDNVRVVSNFMDFNDEGLLIGFQEPIIHSFNKTVASIANSDYNQKILSKRRNVILLGDSTADPNMTEGLFDENAEINSVNGAQPINILRIGFLNSNVETLLETYKNLYDIVICGDGTFDLPFDILNNIINSDSIDVKS